MVRSHHPPAHPMVLLAAGALLAAGVLLLFGQEQAAAILATAVITFVVLLTAWDMVKDMMRGHWGLELDTLISRAPAFAHRSMADGTDIVRIPVDEVQVGDTLLLRSSEVLPMDGVVVSQRATAPNRSPCAPPPLPRTPTTPPSCSWFRKRWPSGAA